MKNVYLYVMDTLADWEPAHAIAELDSGRFFKTPGARLPVVPAATLADVTPDTAAAFLLPGSNVWDVPKCFHELMQSLPNRQ